MARQLSVGKGTRCSFRDQGGSMQIRWFWSCSMGRRAIAFRELYKSGQSFEMSTRVQCGWPTWLPAEVGRPREEEIGRRRRASDK